MNTTEMGASASPDMSMSQSGDDPMTASIGASTQKPPSNFRACRVCKARKVKCVPGPEGHACAYCQRHGTECVQIEPQVKRRRTGNVGELKARIEQLEGRLQQAMDGPLLERRRSMSPGRHLRPLSRKQSASPRFAHAGFDTQSPVLPPLPINNNYFTMPAAGTEATSSIAPYPPMGPPARLFESWQVGSATNTSPANYTPAVLNSNAHRDATLPPPSALRSIMEPLPSASALRLNRTGQPPTSSARSERPKQDGDDEGSVGCAADIQADRLLGPLSTFDDQFFDLCLQQGLANQDANAELPPEKRVFWNSLSRLSSGALSIFRISFPNSVIGNYSRAEIPEEAANEFAAWQRLYGDRLTELFMTHVAPRVISRTTSKAHFEELMTRSYSFPCAVYALAACCNTDWTVPQRIRRGNAFHRFAGTYFQREVYPITMDSLKTLLLLSEYPVQYENLLLTSWCVSFAFELKLHIDPEDWALPEDEKYQRRVIWWYIVMRDRISSMTKMQVLITDDTHDVRLPDLRCRYDLWLVAYISICSIVARMVTTLYSVRGIRTLNDHPEVSAVVAKQLVAELEVLKNQVRDSYAEQAAVTEQDPEISPVLVQISHLHMRLIIEGAIINAHRPFLQSSKLSVFDSLDHQRRLVKACNDYVDLIDNMDPVLCDELWPWTIAILNVIVSMVLLRLLMLCPDVAVQQKAKVALETFLRACKRFGKRWHFARVGQGVARFANTITGTQAFAAYTHHESAEEVAAAEEVVAAAAAAAAAQPSNGSAGGQGPWPPFDYNTRAAFMSAPAVGGTDDIGDWAALLAGAGMDSLFLAGNWGM
ncbi:hypothetical protein BCR37DRAFT_392294 [Protomyces lactucae-debilis]|uniref:Zn(2)-C6 fungal-type domain-containing protein n=1 Tax=Protomyces lactucae-debilis TaxID=2754530 RepID=A0A1Y2FM45_PROLT|nr:uncharacterized protein BCR37DRAFT_392294 [Protomyces lactucae-debilis]ORY83845.1 hypothetical protein BCR37DRAFT_392294 [Protomyces lactucae-debilis]